MRAPEAMLHLFMYQSFYILYYVVNIYGQTSIISFSISSLKKMRVGGWCYKHELKKKKKKTIVSHNIYTNVWAPKSFLNRDTFQSTSPSQYYNIDIRGNKFFFFFFFFSPIIYQVPVMIRCSFF
jgi:hypothetical protein